MNLQTRVETFKELGKELRQLPEAEIDELYFRATAHNNWFTRENVAYAIGAIGEMLNEKKLDQWLSDYDLHDRKEKTIAVIMAGNIPLVGFHDFLTNYLLPI